MDPELENNGTTPETGDQGTETNPTPAPTEVKLTPAQLKDRLARAQRVERENLLKDLGVKDTDELKNVLAEAKQAKLDKLSEKERLEAQLTAERTEKEQYKAAAERLARETKEAEAAKALTTIALANGANADDLDVVQAKAEVWIAKNLADDDEVTEEALKPFFEELKSKKPVLFRVTEEPAGTHKKETKAPETPKGTSRSSNPDAPPKPIAEMTKVEFAAYKKSKGWA